MLSINYLLFENLILLHKIVLKAVDVHEDSLEVLEYKTQNSYYLLPKYIYLLSKMLHINNYIETRSNNILFKNIIIFLQF